eukprot:GHVS01059902.1.p2 GENE.GHVS01059902.1~~GHVS01059902.1.p2  ORF type:complete len:300 (-),score=63.90 GHVS01059902.1:2203-3102(-)
MENRKVRGNMTLPNSSGSARRGNKSSGVAHAKATKEAHKAVLERARHVRDMFEQFAAFQKYERNGLNVTLKHVSAMQVMGEGKKERVEQGSVPVGELMKGGGDGGREKGGGGVLRKVFELTKRNMQEVYDKTNFDEQGWNDETKWTELNHPDAQFLLAFSPNNSPEEKQAADSGTTDTEDSETLAGFMHFRFETDEDNPGSEKDAVVAYIWDLQLEEWAQRKGLGNHMMNVLELTGRQVGISKLMCTVLKDNADAMRFYRGKCRFAIDESSPDMFLQLDDDELCEYDILKKDLKKQKDP